MLTYSKEEKLSIISRVMGDLASVGAEDNNASIMCQAIELLNQYATSVTEGKLHDIKED